MKATVWNKNEVGKSSNCSETVNGNTSEGHYRANRRGQKQFPFNVKALRFCKINDPLRLTLMERVEGGAEKRLYRRLM